jgi:hypothetical protein
MSIGTIRVKLEKLFFCEFIGQRLKVFSDNSDKSFKGEQKTGRKGGWRSRLVKQIGRGRIPGETKNL